MKTQSKQPEKEKFILKIDDRTIITVRTREAVDKWIDKYPDATVVKSKN